MRDNASRLALSKIIIIFHDEEYSMIASNKFASILSSSLIIGLLILVLVLMFQVRNLYHDHLKLQRLQEYKNELESISAHFETVQNQVNQVRKEFKPLIKDDH